MVLQIKKYSLALGISALSFFCHSFLYSTVTLLPHPDDEKEYTITCKNRRGKILMKRCTANEPVNIPAHTTGLTIIDQDKNFVKFGEIFLEDQATYHLLPAGHVGAFVLTKVAAEEDDGHAVYSDLIAYEAIALLCLQGDLPFDE